MGSHGGWLKGTAGLANGTPVLPAWVPSNSPFSIKQLSPPDTLCSAKFPTEAIKHEELSAPPERPPGLPGVLGAAGWAAVRERIGFAGRLAGTT